MALVTQLCVIYFFFSQCFNSLTGPDVSKHIFLHYILSFSFFLTIFEHRRQNNESWSSEQLLINDGNIIFVAASTRVFVRWLAGRSIGRTALPKKKKKRTTITATKQSRKMKRAAFCWLILMTIDFHWKCSGETSEQIVKCFIWWAKSMWCSMQDWSPCTFASFWESLPGLRGVVTPPFSFKKHCDLTLSCRHCTYHL